MHAVFRHHDGAVDDRAEVDRAQAHQVDRDAEQIHPDEAEQQRQRNGERDHQRRTPVAKEDQQDHDHKHGGFDQVAADGRRGRVDHVGLVVEGNDLRACGSFRPAIFALISLMIFCRSPRAE